MFIKKIILDFQEIRDRVSNYYGDPVEEIGFNHLKGYFESKSIHYEVIVDITGRQHCVNTFVLVDGGWYLTTGYEGTGLELSSYLFSIRNDMFKKVGVKELKMLEKRFDSYMGYANKRLGDLANKAYANNEITKKTNFSKFVFNLKNYSKKHIPGVPFSDKRVDSDGKKIDLDGLEKFFKLNSIEYVAIEDFTEQGGRNAHWVHVFALINQVWYLASTEWVNRGYYGFYEFRIQEDMFKEYVPGYVNELKRNFKQYEKRIKGKYSDLRDPGYKDRIVLKKIFS